jgi:hypothetical protein
MNSAFEDALIDDDAIEPLIAAMQNDPKDRHVLAAAVARGAGGIVTDNVKDFPAEACDPWGITITTADEFLCVLYGLQSDLVCEALAARVSNLTTPSLTLADVLARLKGPTATSSSSESGSTKASATSRQLPMKPGIRVARRGCKEKKRPTS